MKKETRIEYQNRIKSEYEEYQKYAEELKKDTNLNDSFIIIDADGEIYSDDIQSLSGLKSKLEDILEDLTQKKEQEEYDEDSDYYRENFESIGENCACRAYEDLKDDWEIKHIFYYDDNYDSPFEEIYVNIEWII